MAGEASIEARARNSQGYLQAQRDSPRLLRWRNPKPHSLPHEKHLPVPSDGRIAQLLQGCAALKHARKLTGA